MSLSRKDWEEILTHTRARIREVGLDEVDAQVTMDFRTTESPSTDFLRYLTSIIGALGERSYTGYQQTLDTFRECLKTDIGMEIDGVQIHVEDRDYGVYGTNLVNLHDQANLSPVIDELKNLRNTLLNAGIFNE